jgi:5-methylcytosine-specific restriction endonuclease McrA
MVTTIHSNSYCEAWVNNKWEVVSVQTARTRPALVVRCLECHGPIVLMQAGRNNTTRAHAEHRPGHSGCSLGHYFDGIRTPHPQQVEAPSSFSDELPESEIAIQDDESAFPEGKEKFKQHRYLERDGKIARKAKAQRLAKTGKLECEVCQLDFAACYGEIGHGFIEAHHKTPVAKLDGTKRTKIEDLALVCSNCHRMLHRGDSLLTVEQLKEKYYENNT